MYTFHSSAFILFFCNWENLKAGHAMFNNFSSGSERVFGELGLFQPVKVHFMKTQPDF